MTYDIPLIDGQIMRHIGTCEESGGIFYFKNKVGTVHLIIPVIQVKYITAI